MNALRNSLRRLSASRKKSLSPLESIVQFRGVALSVLKNLKDELLAKKLAPDVELAVLVRAVDEKSFAGEVVRLVKKDKSQLRKWIALTRSERKIVVQEGSDFTRLKRDEWTTEAFCHYVIVPMTKPKSCFYLDLVEKKKLVGKEYKGTFVSQARKSKFCNLVDALVDSENGEALDKKFVWLDFLSANQPVLLDPSPPTNLVNIRYDLLASGLHTAIDKFENVALFMDSWSNPTPLTRLWCVWEVYRVVEQGKKVKLLFSPGEEEAFLQNLKDDFEGIEKILSNIDMRNADCFVEADALMITGTVEDSLPNGFSDLNETILTRLRSWIADSTKLAINQSRQELAKDETKLETFLAFLVQSGRLMRLQAQYEMALKYYKEALDLKFEKQENFRGVASIYNNMGLIYSLQGELESALEHYQVSLMFTNSKTKESDLGRAVTIESLANVFVLQGKPDQALKSYNTVMEIRKRWISNSDDLEILVTEENIAGLKLNSGDLESAKKTYKRVLSIRESKLGPDHPSTALAHENVARVSLKDSNLQDAKTHNKEALRIRLEKLGKFHPETATSYINLGHTFQALGDMENARENYRTCLEIRKVILPASHAAIKEAQESVDGAMDQKEKELEEKRIYDEMMMTRNLAMPSFIPEQRLY